jgi:hypothetical protein
LNDRTSLAYGFVVGEGVVFVDDKYVGKYSAWMMLSWRYGDDVAMTDVCGQRSCELIHFISRGDDYHWGVPHDPEDGA